MAQKEQHIVVFGSFVVDLMSRVPRLPVAGETVKSQSFAMGPGGKGSNQAIAARRAGPAATVTMITRVGTDPLAEIAMKTYEDEGMTTRHFIRDPDRPTAAALIMVDAASGENKIAVFLGACDHFTDAEVTGVKDVLASADVVVCQLETNLAATRRAIEIAHAAGTRVILNPAPAQPLADDLLAMVDVLTPNETEAALLAGLSIRPETIETDARAAARALLARGVGSVIVTLGRYGALVVTPDEIEFLPPVAVAVVDTTGAGDAFNGGLAVGLAEGKSLVEAARFANVVGALSVTRVGTAPAMPRRAEIDARLQEDPRDGRRGEDTA